MPLNEHRLVIGFRDDDPRRWKLQCDITGGIPAGRCIDCRHEVYVDGGAIKAIRERATLVGCMFCQEQVRDRELVHQSGLIAQL